jgi:AraC-like DNA-binding protein
LYARNLLDSTQLNIEEVARQAGLLTPHYFSRKYRQAFGVSPRDYRFQKGEVSPLDDGKEKQGWHAALPCALHATKPERLLNFGMS